MVMRGLEGILALGDRIASLSPAEAAQLCGYLETTYGLRPESLPVRIVPEPDVIPDPLPEPLFSILLEGFDPGRRLVLIKTLRELLPLGLIEARNLVEQLPSVLAKHLPPEEAQGFKQKVELVGGRVRVA